MRGPKSNTWHRFIAFAAVLSCGGELAILAEPDAGITEGGTAVVLSCYYADMYQCVTRGDLTTVQRQAATDECLRDGTLGIACPTTNLVGCCDTTFADGGLDGNCVYCGPPAVWEQGCTSSGLVSRKWTPGPGGPSTCPGG
jgi:hypothetical protein